MSIPIQPMLAKKAPNGIPKGDYAYETKWDGMRVIVHVVKEPGTARHIRLYTRRGLEVTDRFPELQTLSAFSFNGVFDGEIVCFDENGKCDFRTTVGRRHNKFKDDIRRRATEAPATVMLFDMLRSGGVDLIDYTWSYRREMLQSAVDPDHYRYKLSPIHEDGDELFNTMKETGAEGIMAKELAELYYPGKRRRAWLKVKILHTEDVLVTGFTPGEGKRKGYFGSLIITDPDGNPLGNVGTGFTDQDLKDYMKMFHEIGAVGDERYFHLLKPIPAEVRHMEKTGNALREPVFMRFRTED